MRRGHATVVVPGLHRIALGGVNAYVVELDDGIALVDTGTPGSELALCAGLADLGHTATDVRHIVVTHLHPDHSGAAAAMAEVSGATVWMHPADANAVRRGEAARPMSPASGVVNGLLYRLVIRDDASVDPVVAEGELADGATLPFGRVRVLHTPGHSLGHVALVIEAAEATVLLAADAVANFAGLGWSIAYEDFGEGRTSAMRLAGFETEDVDLVCFGHGRPVDRRRYVARFGS